MCNWSVIMTMCRIVDLDYIADHTLQGRALALSVAPSFNRHLFSFAHVESKAMPC